MDKRNGTIILLIVLIIFISIFTCCSGETDGLDNVIYLTSPTRELWETWKEKIPGVNMHFHRERNHSFLPIAFVIPHHGLIGSHIMYFYSRISEIRTNVKYIVLMGPDHFAAGLRPITIGSTDFVWQDNRINSLKEVSDIWMKKLGLETDNSPFMKEHSILLHIPFISVYFPDAVLIPVIFRFDCTRADALKLAALIWDFFKKHQKNTIIINSMDFSHGLSNDDTIKADRKSAEFILSRSSYYPAGLTTDGRMVYLTSLNALHPVISIIDIINNTSTIVNISEERKEITSYFFIIFYK